MKKSILTLLTILLSTILIAQDQKINSNKSNAEIFSSKSGTLIEKQFKNIGDINRTKLKIVKYTDMISGESLNSIRFESKISGKYTSDTKIASLDMDEIGALIKSIEIINESVFDFPPKDYTEITFKSRSGLKAGCYWSTDHWKPYIQIKKHDRKSLIVISKEEFLKLLELLKEVKNQLK